MNLSSLRPGLRLFAVVFCVAGATWAMAPAFAAPEGDKKQSPKTADAPKGIDGAAKVLAKLDDEWSAAAVARDVDKVASFYAEDAVAYPPNEPVCVGREAAKKVWAAYLAEPSFSISWKSTHAEISKSGELGFTSGTYEAKYNGPDGKPVLEKGKFLCVWKQQKDGTWKAVHDMWNTDSK